MILLHVEEGVTSQVYGELSSTAEVARGAQYFHDILEALRAQSIDAELLIRHSRSPSSEIIKMARERKPDLVVMGAHGHKGLKDIIFGATINAVRHELDAPVLIVRDDRKS
jgi:manganese transport protein